MNKKLWSKLLEIDTNHNKKVGEHKQVLNVDNLYIDLWKIVMAEIGLPTGLDYLFDKYFDEFTIGNSIDFDGYVDFLISEMEYYKKNQEDQSVERRLKRLKEGLCPIHGYVMTQVDGWFEDKNDDSYTIAGCPIDDCVRVKAYARRDEEGKNELLSEWQYLMWENQ